MKTKIDFDRISSLEVIKRYSFTDYISKFKAELAKLTAFKNTPLLGFLHTEYPFLADAEKGKSEQEPLLIIGTEQPEWKLFIKELLKGQHPLDKGGKCVAMVEVTYENQDSEDILHIKFLKTKNPSPKAMMKDLKKKYQKYVHLNLIEEFDQLSEDEKEFDQKLKENKAGLFEHEVKKADLKLIQGLINQYRATLDVHLRKQKADELVTVCEQWMEAYNNDTKATDKDEAKFMQVQKVHAQFVLAQKDYEVEAAPAKKQVEKDSKLDEAELTSLYFDIMQDGNRFLIASKKKNFLTIHEQSAIINDLLADIVTWKKMHEADNLHNTSRGKIRQKHHEEINGLQVKLDKKARALDKELKAFADLSELQKALERQELILDNIDMVKTPGKKLTQIKEINETIARTNAAILEHETH